MTVSNPPPAPMVSTPATSITVADLQGNWGLASFRNEEDRARTEVAAKAACSNPYQVTPGAGGGVMMYLADKTEPSEVFVKVGSGGEVFIGPRGAPAMAEDRQVISYQNNVLINRVARQGQARPLRHDDSGQVQCLRLRGGGSCV
jgi:hypothetical protein